jgi:hypothetical protein
MARIGHIALLTKDTEKLAGFYKTSLVSTRSRAAVKPANMDKRSIYPTVISTWRFCRRATAKGIFHFGMRSKT